MCVYVCMYVFVCVCACVVFVSLSLSLSLSLQCITVFSTNFDVDLRVIYLCVWVPPFFHPRSPFSLGAQFFKFPRKNRLRSEEVEIFEYAYKQSHC